MTGVYRIEVIDRRGDGGPWVVFIRRHESRIAIGVGADRHALRAAVASAVSEVRYRRRAGQFRAL
jgi:hypothetical protein